MSLEHFEALYAGDRACIEETRVHRVDGSL